MTMKTEDNTGEGWTYLGRERYALEVPGGVFIECTYEDRVALCFAPSVTMAQLISANNGEEQDNDD